MKNLTSIILENSRKIPELSHKQKTPAMIASIFSVLFSLSIVLELRDIVSPIVMVFLTIFTILFLILNETIKVREIKNVFKGNRMKLIPFLVTFVISISLSGVGIYFWTNNGLKAKKITSNRNVNLESSITKDYYESIESIRSEVYENSKHYKSLVNDLDYWKNKSAASLEERNTIRDYIKDIELKISEGREDFNLMIDNRIQLADELRNSKLKEINTNYSNQLSEIEYNNNISYIFLIMILITELAIVVLNIDLVKLEIDIEKVSTSKEAKFYMITRKVLESLYLSNRDGNVSLMMALSSPALNKLDWDDQKKWNNVKKLYNLFISLGILDNGYVKNTGGKKILNNKLVMNESEALNKFDDYYNRMLLL